METCESCGSQTTAWEDGRMIMAAIAGTLPDATKIHEPTRCDGCGAFAFSVPSEGQRVFVPREQGAYGRPRTSAIPQVNDGSSLADSADRSLRSPTPRRCPSCGCPFVTDTPAVTCRACNARFTEYQAALVEMASELDRQRERFPDAETLPASLRARWLSNMIDVVRYAFDALQSNVVEMGTTHLRAGRAETIKFRRAFSRVPGSGVSNRSTG